MDEIILCKFLLGKIYADETIGTLYRVFYVTEYLY